MTIDEYDIYIEYTFWYTLLTSVLSFQFQSIIPVWYSSDKNILYRSISYILVSTLLGFLILLFLNIPNFNSYKIDIIIQSLSFSLTLALGIFYNQSNKILFSNFWHCLHPLVLFFTFLVISQFFPTAHMRIRTATFSCLLILIYVLIKNRKIFYLKIKNFKAHFSYSFPLIFHVLIGILLFNYYKITLSDSNEVGLISKLSIIFSISMFFILVSDIIYKIWQPYAYRQIENCNFRLLFKNYIYLIIFTLLISVISFFIIPVMTKIIAPPDFQINSSIVFFYVSIIIFFQLSYRLILPIAQFFKNTKIILLFNVVCSILFFTYFHNNNDLNGFLVSLILYYVFFYISLLIYSVKKINGLFF